MNTKKIALKYNFVVECGNQMQGIRLAVSNLSDWSQGNEQVKTRFIVVLVFG